MAYSMTYTSNREKEPLGPKSKHSTSYSTMENFLAVPMVWNSNYLIPHWTNQLIFYPSTLQGGTALLLWTNAFWSESLLTRMLTRLVTSLVSDFLKTTNRKGRATRLPHVLFFFFNLKRKHHRNIFTMSKKLLCRTSSQQNFLHSWFKKKLRWSKSHEFKKEYNF